MFCGGQFLTDIFVDVVIEGVIVCGSFFSVVERKSADVIIAQAIGQTVRRNLPTSRGFSQYLALEQNYFMNLKFYDINDNTSNNNNS